MSKLDQDIKITDSFEPITVGQLLAWLDTLDPEDRARALNAELAFDGGSGRSDELTWMPADIVSVDRISINW